MRVTALITLVIGKPSESRSIMPGAEAELLEAEAKRLIALGFAEARIAAVVKPVDLQERLWMRSRTWSRTVSGRMANPR